MIGVAADGWLPEAWNGGWTYRDRVPPALAGLLASAFYASCHGHSAQEVWRQRLCAGQIRRNGSLLREDQPLAAGDQLAWQRPAWIEGAVPATWQVVHDDGDLLVIDKPSGLPVLPAGGWLEHTALRLLERRHQGDPAGIPRPVHRLGRFTSGLLVCARRRQTRAWLSRQLRESTEAVSRLPRSTAGAASGGLMTAQASPDSAAVEACGSASFLARSPVSGSCRKSYRALLVPGVLALEPAECLLLETAIGRRPHPRLGQIWCAADGSEPGDLPARSTLTLLERSPAADLVDVVIASGRPHQIRIQCAAIGAPLLGDPLYLPGGGASADARPGDGGYRLQAWRLEIERPAGAVLELEVACPLSLEVPMAAASA